MSDGESKTAYEQFLEQAQEEVVHQERNSKDEFLNYRDIANRLFSIAKRESLPYLTNRFQLLAAIAVGLALLGHCVIYLNTGFTTEKLKRVQEASETKIGNLQGLTANQREAFRSESKTQLKASTYSVNVRSIYLQLVFGMGTLWISGSVFLSCRRVSNKNSDRNLFRCAAAATHNFLLWKLRSPSNASTYSIFVDFDQIESDDIDYEQLQKMFSNAHHSLNRQGIYDFFLMAIIPLPALFVPVFGLGVYLGLVALGFALSLARHVHIIGPFECLNNLPKPIDAPYPQNEMRKSDGEDGYPG